MSFKLYSEIFEEFDEASSRKEKIDILRKYDHPRFREFLVYAFNEKYKFDVEIPEYSVSIVPAGLNDCYLHQEIPKLYRFIEGHPKRMGALDARKQRNLLIPILEGLYRDEADLLVKAIKKKLDIKFLTPSLIKEAFPGIEL